MAAKLLVVTRIVWSAMLTKSVTPFDTPAPVSSRITSQNGESSSTARQMRARPLSSRFAISFTPLPPLMNFTLHGPVSMISASSALPSM